LDHSPKDQNNTIGGFVQKARGKQPKQRSRHRKQHTKRQTTQSRTRLRHQRSTHKILWGVNI